METKLKAKDLMIWDWVSIDNKPHKVTGIQICDGIMCVQTDYTDTYYSIENYAPIHITADVLEKNGFLKSLWEIYRLPKTDFSIEQTGGLFILRISNERLCEVKSVSHLQHLLRDFNVDKEIVL